MADFIFQPKQLVNWKIKSKTGGIVHALIHFVVTTLILLPFIMNGHEWLLYAIIFISVAHFFIDLAKINYSLAHDKKLKPFVIDQLLHLFVIMIVYFFAVDINFTLPDTQLFQLYTNPRILLTAIYLALSGVVFKIRKI